MGSEDAGKTAGDQKDSAEELQQLRKLYEAEKKKNEQLAAELKEREKKFTEQYQKLLQVEQGIISGEEALRTIEQEHIDSLSYHLRKEHKAKLELEKTLEDERKRFEDEIAAKDRNIASFEKTVRELNLELNSTREEVLSKDSALQVKDDESWEKILAKTGLASDLDLGFEGEHETVNVQLQDLLKLLGRIGKIRVSDAARNLGTDEKQVMKFAKLLHKKNFVKVENLKSGDPTLRATKELIGKLSELRLKLRRKGRKV